MKHKKVELTELFYDLVFVYAISQMTSLIHHLHHGVVAFESFLIFGLALVVLINSWMIQTVFTNRYGSNSLVNIIFMAINMAAMLYLSDVMIQDPSQITFLRFDLIVGIISATLLFQYILQFFREKRQIDRDLIRLFIAIFSFRVLAIFISLFLPFLIGIVVFIIGIVGSTFMPMVFSKAMQKVPINFPHLVERLSLLVIIMFGEMIIGISPYFKSSTFSLSSLLIFLIVACLFMFYIIEIDHAIDEEKENVSGNGLIYMHYPIFIGLSMITVSLNFIGNAAAHGLFRVFFIFAGLLLFYLGVYLQFVYNKMNYSLTKPFLFGQITVLLLGFIMSLIFASQSQVLIAIIFLTIFLMTSLFIAFNIKRSDQVRWF